VTRVVPALSDQNIGRARRHGVTLRAILIAFLLTPLNVLFLVHATWTVGSFTGGESLFANAVASSSCRHWRTTCSSAGAPLGHSGPGNC